MARSRANPFCGYELEYMICAVFAVRIMATADDSLAAILARSRLGIAMAAPTRIKPTSTPPLRLTSRIALSSPYAQTATGVLSPVTCEMESARSGDILRRFMAAIAIGSS